MSSEMRNSGIPWIGDIPKDWTVCFIKQIMRNKSIKGYPDEMVLSLYRDYGVVPKDSRDDNHNVTSEDTSSYKFVEVGDFVINKMKAWQGSMAVSDYQGIISPAYYICRFINNEIDRKYIHYLLRNDTYKAEYMRLSSGMRVGQWDLNIDDFLRIKMVLPSLSEQQKIASFLDRKCAEIDEMIALQEKIVEELKAYKQSVITEAVTKGLNPDVPMKNSGVEWIGDIPEHWKQCRLKNYFHLHGRIGWNGLRSDEFEESSYAYLVTGQDFKAKDIDWKKCYQIRKERYDEDPFIQLTEGDILVTKDGTIGKVAVVKNLNKPACLNSGIFVVKQYEPKCFDSGYVYWLLVSPLLKTFNDFLNLGGTTIIHLYQNVFERMPLVLPPLEEQQAIANHLDKICSEIDSLIRIKESKIDSLKEYKKSIIYEYVTGKKEITE